MHWPCYILQHIPWARHFTLTCYTNKVCMYGVSHRYDGSRPQSLLVLACVRLWLCRPICDAQSRPQTWHRNVSMFDEGWIAFRLILLSLSTLIIIIIRWVLNDCAHLKMVCWPGTARNMCPQQCLSTQEMVYVQLAQHQPEKYTHPLFH